MFIEFTVGNFRSFRERVTFSMLAANITAASASKHLDEDNVFSTPNKLTLLRSAAIYGANASGKSNLIRALEFMRRFVINSSKESQISDPIKTEPFLLDSEHQDKPSFFEVIFIVNDSQYRYGFEADQTKITTEWLYQTPILGLKLRERQLFKRAGQDIALSKKFFTEGKLFLKNTRENALFLSVCAQFNGETSTEITNWLSKLEIISDFTNSNKFSTVDILNNGVLKPLVSDFLMRFDLGIVDFEIDGEVKPNNFWFGPKIKTHRRKIDTGEKQIFDLDENESEGTKKIFALAGILMFSLKFGTPLIIDELDSKLHLLLTQKIIQLFNSSKTNLFNAQLIFTTHDTNLLSNKIFRRDQIWFTEKDKNESTNLYSLAEYKIRNDASFERAYLEGRFGAVPFIGDLSQIFEAAHG